jgi:hypothetical protein
MFQIPGTSYKIIGFEYIDDMVTSFVDAERIHLEAALKFISSMGMMDSLRKKDWIAVAAHYNGPGQKDHYAEKFESAYSQLVKK